MEGLDVAKFPVNWFQRFLLIVVDGNIDFTGNYVLTNFNPRSVSCKNFTAWLDEDKITFKAIDKGPYGLPIMFRNTFLNL